MTILTVCQSLARRLSENVPTSIVGNNAAAFLLEMVIESSRAIVRAHEWQALRREHTWVATATEVQADAFPADFSRMVKESFWNRTDQRRVVGPLTADEWQYLKASVSSAIEDQYTVRAGMMYLDPIPEAGEVFAYEYITNLRFQDASMVGKATITADSDVFRVDEELLTLEALWRYRQAKGLDFESDFQKAVAYSMQIRAQEQGGGRTVFLDGYDLTRSPCPGGRYPEGNWSLT